MAEETHFESKSINPSRKRKAGHHHHGKSSKAKKQQKQFLGVKDRVKRMDPRLKKILRKKARDYNSDDDDEDETAHGIGEKDPNLALMSDGDNNLERTETQHLGIEVEGSENEDENGEIQPGITKFTEGCRAFKIAFLSIMKKSVSDDSLGPVLSGHKKLVAEKLAEEAAERKVKREVRKEKQLVGEKGHVKPANHLDSHEKFLISVATKGVVKLFNAVNKAQNAQKGLDPSRSKDAKVIKKKRKETFFSELGKAPVAGTSTKVHTSSSTMDNEGPSWAPLHDNYMLTNSKLKDWDKMPDTAEVDDMGNMSEDSSSSDDE